jgi:hypothetical protein
MTISEFTTTRVAQAAPRRLQAAPWSRWSRYVRAVGAVVLDHPLGLNQLAVSNCTLLLRTLYKNDKPGVLELMRPLIEDYACHCVFVSVCVCVCALCIACRKRLQV